MKLSSYPHLVKEWHPTKNLNLTPKQVTSKTNKKVWWLCSNNHTFQAVRKDTMNFWNNLDDNGYMIFHDYGNKQGVTEFVDDWVNYFKEAKVIRQEHNLIVVQNV